MTFRNFAALLAIFVAGFFTSHLTRPSPAARHTAEPDQRAVTINHPDAASPSGRSTFRGEVFRVAGPAGVTAYREFEENEDGTLKLSADDWVLSLGANTYVITRSP